MTNLNTSYRRFRIIAISEAISYLVLLFIAMPLKYYAGLPFYVKITGWIHGLLFIAYIVSMLELAYLKKWSILKLFLAFMASLIPFAPFYLEKKIKKGQF